MGAPRLRRANTVEEMEAVVDDLHVQGYEILERGEASVMLRKKTWGHPGWHVVGFLIVGWWTFGIWNVLYAISAHYRAEKVLVKLGGPQSGRFARE